MRHMMMPERQLWLGFGYLFIVFIPQHCSEISITLPVSLIYIDALDLMFYLFHSNTGLYTDQA